MAELMETVRHHDACDAICGGDSLRAASRRANETAWAARATEIFSASQALREKLLEAQQPWLLNSRVRKGALRRL